MNIEVLKNGFYDLSKKKLGYLPVMDERTYRKVGDSGDELVEDIYGKGFLFCGGKLKLIWTTKREKGFDYYNDKLWIILI